jgi:hypothetical protein
MDQSTSTTTTKAWLILILFLMAFLVTTEGGQEKPIKDGTHDHSDHHPIFGSPLVPCPFITTCCVLFPGPGPYGGPPPPGSEGIPSPGWPKPDGPKPHEPKDSCTDGQGDIPKGDGEPGHDQDP